MIGEQLSASLFDNNNNNFIQNVIQNNYLSDNFQVSSSYSKFNRLKNQVTGSLALHGQQQRNSTTTTTTTTKTTVSKHHHHHHHHVPLQNITMPSFPILPMNNSGTIITERIKSSTCYDLDYNPFCESATRGIDLAMLIV